MQQEASDTNSSARLDSLRSSFNELRGLAKHWSSPYDLVQELKRLMAERPLLAIGAAVAIGAILHGRIFRRSHRYY